LQLHLQPAGSKHKVIEIASVVQHLLKTLKLDFAILYDK
jgi:hypothetical protein